MRLIIREYGSIHTSTNGISYICTFPSKVSKILHYLRYHEKHSAGCLHFQWCKKAMFTLTRSEQLLNA